MRLLAVAGLAAACGGALGADAGEILEATTATGEMVRLHPNGRWEYVDQARQADAKKLAESYPENRTVPIGAQGGLFGIGRTILPGDKDYNRGTLNPKMR